MKIIKSKNKPLPKKKDVRGKSIVNKETENLRKQAEEHTQIVHKTPETGETVVKKGEPLEHSNKHFGVNTIGLSKGLTKNMDNYESLRVDCWLSKEIKPEDNVQEELDKLSDIIEERIIEEVRKAVE